MAAQAVPMNVAMNQPHPRNAALVSVMAALLFPLMVACNDASGHPAAANSGEPSGPPLVLSGATLIDGTGGTVLTESVVVVEDGRFSCVGNRTSCPIPDGSEVVDVEGKWIMPGLIDTHMHFSQTGWVDGRPDALDRRDLYPYEQTSAWLQQNSATLGRSYLCSGVTAVYDVGGYPWTWTLQHGSESNPDGPIVRSAGPLLATIDFWLNLPGQAQFIHTSDEETVRAAVRSHAAFGANSIKIWYIVRQGADRTHLSAMVHAAGDEANKVGLPLIVHATGLWQAKDAVRAGAKLLVHSVEDSEVDQEFIDLALAQGTHYNPTLLVRDGYVQVRTREVDQERQPFHCVDPTTLAKVRSTDTIPTGAGRFVEGGLEEARNESQPALDRMSRNLLVLHEAGVPVVLGTDAGNPLTLHGASVYMELEAMADAGLSAMDVVVAATRNGAQAMGVEDAGTIVVGNWADAIVLSADPLEDISNIRQLELVVRAGRLHRQSDLRFDNNR